MALPKPEDVPVINAVRESSRPAMVAQGIQMFSWLSVVSEE